MFKITLIPDILAEVMHAHSRFTFCGARTVQSPETTCSDISSQVMTVNYEIVLQNHVGTFTLLIFVVQKL